MHIISYIALFMLCLQSSIVDHLKDRYDKDIIYTYIGDILLAVNPFKQLSIYTEEVRSLYWIFYFDDCMPYIIVCNE